MSELSDYSREFSAATVFQSRKHHCMRIFCQLLARNPVRIIINFPTKMDNNENNTTEDVENVIENGAANVPSPGMLFDSMMEGAFDDVAAIMANFVFDHQLLGMYDNMLNLMSTCLLPEGLDTLQLDSPSTDLSSIDSSSSSDDEQKQVQEHHQEIKEEQSESVDKDKDLNLKKN